MAWYGHPVWPYAMLVPAGLAGALLPYVGRSQQDPRLRALGTMVAWGGVCSLLTQLELGASMMGAFWVLAGLLTLYDVSYLLDIYARRGKGLRLGEQGGKRLRGSRY